MSGDKQTGIDGLIGGWGNLGGGDYVRPTAGGWVFLSTVTERETHAQISVWGEPCSEPVSVSTSASVVFIPDPTWSWKEYRRVCSRPAGGES